MPAALISDKLSPYKRNPSKSALKSLRVPFAMSNCIAFPFASAIRLGKVSNTTTHHREGGITMRYENHFANRLVKTSRTSKRTMELKGKFKSLNITPSLVQMRKRVRKQRTGKKRRVDDQIWIKHYWTGGGDEEEHSELDAHCDFDDAWSAWILGPASCGKERTKSGSTLVVVSSPSTCNRPPS